MRPVPIGPNRWTGPGRRSYGFRVAAPSTQRWAAAVPVAAAVALLLLPACTAAGEPTPLPTVPVGSVAGTGSAPATTPADPPPTRTPSASAGTVDRTDPLAVYLAWWQALQAAYARADPAHPALDDYAVDPILSRQRAKIRSLRDQGVVQRTALTQRPRLLYRTQQYAEVADCVRGPANTYYDARTGRLRAPSGYRNDLPTEDRLLTRLQKRGDQWFVVAATAGPDAQC